MKKLFSILLVIALLLPIAASAGTIGSGPMYVYTKNGKSLNVRSEPHTGDNVIGHLKFGAEVNVVGMYDGWAEIPWGDTTAFIQASFLQWDKPDHKPTPQEDPNEEERSKQKRELNSEVEIDPITIQVHTTRPSGRVNLRKEPSKLGKRVESCTDGLLLQAIGETNNWYRATDPATGKTGYIYKDHVSVVTVPAPVSVDTTENLGKLSVNGEFTLQAKIPEGYRLQIISAQKTRIIANLISDDPARPQMMLTVAYDDTFADVEKMNDMSDEDIEVLKKSFTDLNDIEFSDAQTGEGTRLLIAKEVGEDEDYVSIVSLYKGYFVEFVLTPNPQAADQTLTDDQIQKCIDFLTDLQFVPAA